MSKIDENRINMIILLILLIGGIGFATFTYQYLVDDSIFTNSEKELIFQKRDSLAFSPEQEQMMWTNLVSENIEKSGYDIDKDTLRLEIKTVFYTNEDYIPLPLEYIKESYKIQQNLLNRNGLKIEFVVKDIQVILGKPKNLPEGIKTDRYSYDIDYFSIKHIDKNALTVVIYNDPMAKEAGMAYGIPSNLMKVEMRALDPSYATIAHEIGHNLGLYHTHKYQKVSDRYTSEDGDYIADTPVSCPLYKLIDTDCSLIENHEHQREILRRREMYKTNVNSLNELKQHELNVLIHNLMSYTYKPCRSSLTKEQMSKVLFTIQTNKDTRGMFLNFRQENILETLSKKIEISG